MKYKVIAITNPSLAGVTFTTLDQPVLKSAQCDNPVVFHKLYSKRDTLAWCFACFEPTSYFEFVVSINNTEFYYSAFYSLFNSN